MAFTELQYTTLTEAIAQGATTVKYGDKEVTYRSLKEMIELKNMIAAELGLFNNNENRGRRYGSFSKGL